ncbi:MAG: outer membrane protein assembly factor BamD [Melioribacteraceae bacterium]|nr:hypothetical protein [Ignavibacteriota bacterium]MBZ0180839.1 outer membrane protein assembly factor BamD [Melioribacteraceae bacterium]|tara:strand:+ start:32 stop:544 length:513 start_codon:yes stop_codon:yes gene_type:complete
MKNSFLFMLVISVIFIAACSAKKDETELYNTAKKSLENQMYYEALVNFRELLNEYPDGQYTAEAIFETGKLYHGKIDTALTDNEAFEKAVEYYNLLQTDFPQHVKAPEALFMASFVLANEIKDFKRAEASYKLFIEKYPDNQLAESAKIELENLGIPPEEILKKKIATEN